jgi:hypothetical protein
VKRRCLILLAIAVCATATCRAQDTARAQTAGTLAPPQRIYAGPARYSQGHMSVAVRGGMAKYTGEFMDKHLGLGAGVTADWTLLPILDAGLRADAGVVRYERRSRRGFGTMYDFQFGKDAPAALRSTTYLSIGAEARVRLFPSERFDCFLVGGVGGTWFSPEDYRTDDAVYHAGGSAASWSFPVGGGFLWHLRPDLAIEVEATNTFVLSGEFDGFASGDLRNYYNQVNNLPERADQAATPGDTYVSISFGLRWFFRRVDDSDGDGLDDQDEQIRNTDPGNPDSDGDGLHDGEEVRSGTDPLRRDSDGDGLTDAAEVHTHRSDPLQADSDRDGLGDNDEVLRYFTDPANPDTDGDGLLDGDEIRAGCDPRQRDTDGDGLTDGDEVVLWRTSPVLIDTDGDGISDGEEIRTRTSDPLSPDSDHDGLTDGEERRLGTDPMRVDSDGDGRSDYDEAKKYGTDPLHADQP